LLLLLLLLLLLGFSLQKTVRHWHELKGMDKRHCQQAIDNFKLLMPQNGFAYPHAVQVELIEQMFVNTKNQLITSESGSGKSIGKPPFSIFFFFPPPPLLFSPRFTL